MSVGTFNRWLFAGTLFVFSLFCASCAGSCGAADSDISDGAGDVASSDTITPDDASGADSSVSQDTAVADVHDDIDDDVDVDDDAGDDARVEGDTLRLCNQGPEGDYVYNKLDPSGKMSEDCGSCITMDRSILTEVSDEQILERDAAVLELQALLNPTIGNLNKDPTYAKVFDVTGDDIPDIVGKFRFVGDDSASYLVEGKEGGGFKPPVYLPWNGGNDCLAYADINNDLGIDAVCLDSNKLRVFWNQGPDLGITSDSPTTVFTIADNNAWPSSVVVADYDIDGDLDLFVSSKTARNRVFRNELEDGFLDVTVAVGLVDEAQTTFYAAYRDGCLTVDNDGNSSCQRHYCWDAELEVFIQHQPIQPAYCDYMSGRDIENWFGRELSESEKDALWTMASSTPDGGVIRIGHFHGVNEEGECGDESTPMGREFLYFGELVCQVMTLNGSPLGNTVTCLVDGKWKPSPQIGIWGGYSTSPQPAFSWRALQLVTGEKVGPVAIMQGFDYQDGGGGGAPSQAYFMAKQIGINYGLDYGKSLVQIVQFASDGKWHQRGDWVDELGVHHQGTAGFHDTGHFVTGNVGWLQLSVDTRQEPYLLTGGYSPQVLVDRVKRAAGMNILRLSLQGTKSTAEGYDVEVTVTCDDGFVTTRTAGHDSYEWPTGNSFGGQIAIGLGSCTNPVVTAKWPVTGKVQDYGILEVQDMPHLLVEEP